MENHEFINPTCMSLADLMKGAPNPAQAAEIMAKWYSKMIGVEPSSIKTIIIDNNSVFPIFHVDTLETIIERYGKMYAVEVKAMVEMIAEGKKDNPSGRSKGGLLQSLMCIPVMLKAAICYQYGDEWFSKKENIRKLASLVPKLLTTDKRI